MCSLPRIRRSRAARLLLTAAAAGLASAAVAVPSPQYTRAKTQSATAPYAGYVNHAQTAPAFYWGWFGAERYAPQPRWHRDYNGDLVRWKNQRRY